MNADTPKPLRVDDLPGIKESQLNSYGKCAVCHQHQLTGDNAGLTFYVIELSHAVFAGDAIRRQVGLGMVLGGNARLASVMGQNEDLAKIVAGPTKVFVHERCALNIGHLLSLMPPEKPDEEEATQADAPADKRDDQHGAAL